MSAASPARTPRRETVEARGARTVSGDLGETGPLTDGASGCEMCFHAAAKVEDWGDPAEFERMNVHGTRNVIVACREAGVRRLVHVGTEAALMAGDPLVKVDEDAPLRPDSPALYSSSKAKAELLVRAANDSDLETVVVRPRFVWGEGDTTLLPALVELVRAGRFRWIGGGRQLSDTTHIDNTVEGPVARRHAGAGGRRLLRHRRRARRFSRFRHRDARHPGRRDPRQERSRGRGRRRSRSRRTPVAPTGEVGIAAPDPLRRLGGLPGMHARHIPGPGRDGLRAANHPRSRPGRACREPVGVARTPSSSSAGSHR